MSVVCPNEKLIKNKNDNSINEYYNFLCENVTNKMPELKKIEKMEKMEKIDEEINEHVPNFNEFGFLIRYNYNLQQLKTIAKTYKLKITGNKSQLISRIYSFSVLNSIFGLNQFYQNYRKNVNFHSND